MPLTDLFTGTAPPTVRQPIFTVEIGGGAVPAGLGDLAGAVGSALGINLGGSADPWQQHLLAIRVECGLAPFVDVAELALAVTPQSPAVALADSASLALGYSDDGAQPVFTGTVTEMRHGLGVQQIRMTNGGGVLAHLRLNQSFEQQTAGDMVRALADQAAVTLATVEAGGDYPFYVFSDGQSVYRHVAELAQQNTFAAWFTVDGALLFAPLAEGDPAATFTYGDNLLALQMHEAPPYWAAATVTGEGAAGSQGAKAWSWLVKDPAAVTSTVGNGAAPRLVNAPGLRTSALTQSSAAGLMHLASMDKVSGRLFAMGTPAVTVGSTIEIANAPPALANGRFLVQHVRHTFARQQGFTTLIYFTKAGEASGGGLLGALGGLL